MTNREQQEKIFRAIGFVGDDLIQRADAPVEARRPNTAWVKWAALAACCVLVIGLASRLPLLGAKTANTAPETASMMLDSTTATTEAKSEAPQMTEETAAEEAPAEAEEAPAEEPAEEARAGEAGSGPRNDTEAECAGAVYDAELAQEILDTTLGPVKLGMPSADVRSILGAPKEDRGEFYVCTDKGDYRYATWAYNLSNDPDYICDVLLRFADVGDGLVLDEIMTFGTSDWALPTGIRNGSSADDVLAAYPDAQVQYNGPDGALSAVVFEAGHVHLHIMVENGGVTNITLGTYYEDPGWVDETSYEEPAYSFASSDIVVYQKASDGWISYHMKDKAAKKLEVVLGIEDLVPIGQAPEPRYYLDFQNGTVVMLGEDRLSGAVYTCGDLAGLRAAMGKGEDPAPYLTCLTVCTFPAGTDEAVQELTLESAASKD
ncbi:MAG: hypothetical protein ACLT8T_13055 [Oscillospiraceae bacterium]